MAALTGDKDLLRFVTCGSVDDGKSTLIGRLLFDSELLLEDQVDRLRQESRHRITGPEGIDFSLLVDGLMAEREQGITIDVAYRFFETVRRRYVVIDAPGHEQYTRNMATGASHADIAVILVDVRKGLTPQTLRHAYIVQLMGVKSVVLAVNKMDAVNFDQGRFDEIVDRFNEDAKRIGLRDVTSVPVSALCGDNVYFPSKHMPWYSGPTLLESLERVERPSEEKRPFRMPVQYVVRAEADFRGYAGLIFSGEISVGDSILIQPSAAASRVARIVTFDGDIRSAHAGQSVTLLLASDVDVSRGDVLASADTPAETADQFAARLVWFDAEPLYHGRSYAIRLGTRLATATITEIKSTVDLSDLSHKPAKTVLINDVSEVKIATDQPVVFDPYGDDRLMGGFVLIDRITNDTVGAGIIDHPLRRGQFIPWQHFEVDRVVRARAKGQQPAVIWMTGLSGSGKSTIADLVERKLTAAGRHCYTLDGDNVRHGLNRDLGFTPADRVENVRRVAETARLMADAGLLVIVSLISPFARERAMARDIAGDINFLEIFVDADLVVCEARDPKGLYAKARSGAIVNFTGIDAPYEVPQSPDMLLATGKYPAERLANDLIVEMKRRNII
jgi:bifunctional enzyme CysN/CysC